MSSPSPSSHGVFTISLDFELYWGVRDKKTLEGYGTNLRGVWQAVPSMLALFEKYEIHVTWATVGFLFHSSLDDLNAHLPDRLPNYVDKNLSPYEAIKDKTSLEKVYHFAPELIELIAKVKWQEMATHTYSHYYCLEPGQTKEDFKADLMAAINLAKTRGHHLESIVLPRNQVNPDYLETLRECGITSYRGNPTATMYQPAKSKFQNKVIRVLRLADAYLNLSGFNASRFEDGISSKPYNFPASRLLRPWSRKLKMLEGLRVARIKKSMTYAAKNNLMYHLWWHPHNLGANQEENFKILEEILTHYSDLKKKYQMASLNMAELARAADEHHAKRN